MPPILVPLVARYLGKLKLEPNVVIFFTGNFHVTRNKITLNLKSSTRIVYVGTFLFILSMFRYPRLILDLVRPLGSRWTC